MAAEGRWVPMKRTALALHHLVSTKFRGDRLQLISFGRYAQTMDIGELTALPAFREQGTNLHHGLLLAGRFFRQHPSMQPVLLVVTDGEPTAHLLADGDSWFNYPPDAETIRVTVAELDRLGRAGVQATFFRLGNDPGLERFVARMARQSTAGWWRPTPAIWELPLWGNTSAPTSADARTTTPTGLHRRSARHRLTGDNPGPLPGRSNPQGSPCCSYRGRRSSHIAQMPWLVGVAGSGLGAGRISDDESVIPAVLSRPLPRRGIREAGLQGAGSAGIADVHCARPVWCSL